MMSNNMDPVEFVEKYFGIELMECQKSMIRKMADKKEIYICYPRHCGYSEYKEILELCGLVERNTKIL